ncbi:MAG TPA: putative zinc-binding protein [Clostridia bacterium]|nr:putative zinc-binding protein [Clostridia bacterium]
MSEICACRPSEIMLFACSGGGSNVGQIANNAALEMAKEGKAKMYCLAGLGGHVPGIIESAKQAKKIIVIDGCPILCAKKIVEHAGLKVDELIVVTDENVDKTPGVFDIKDEEIVRIKNLIESKINGVVENIAAKG